VLPQQLTHVEVAKAAVLDPNQRGRERRWQVVGYTANGVTRSEPTFQELRLHSARLVEQRTRVVEQAEMTAGNVMPLLWSGK